MISKHIKTLKQLSLVKEITGCLLEYHYFKGNCKMIGIDLSK